MPIEFIATADGEYVQQGFLSPTVYMDHWAIRLLSDDRTLQDRFVKALQAKRGTLLLSNISLSEFSAASDAHHCRDAEILFSRVMPNIYFTDFALLDKLLAREEAQPDSEMRQIPPPDLWMLKFCAENARDTSGKLTMNGIVTLSHTHRDQLIAATDSMVQMVRHGIERTRNDPFYMAKFRKLMPDGARPRTEIILGELLRDFKLGQTKPISDNDVLDLLHAVMPINCCDFVLLDGPWTERIEKMRRRIQKANLVMPIAQCFSKRNEGVFDFLKGLEGFKSAPTAAEPSEA